MAYRDRDPLENVGKQEPPKDAPEERPSLLRSVKRAVRNAILRQVSTKQ
jgi:hypothetical protein